MPSDTIYNTNNHLFQKFFLLMGNLVHSDLKRQIEYMKVENEILRSKCPKRITTTASEKRRLIKFGLLLGGDIKKLISIVNYSTFRRWIVNCMDKKIELPRQGRPRKTTEEIRQLIIQMARDNNWGYSRILGELKKLNIMSLSPNTIKKILIENGIDPVPQRSRDSWDAYIKRTFETLWACDFFTKTVWTPFGPKLFHVLFFININSRKVHIAGITTHPKKEWVENAARSVSFLFKDGDKKLIVRDGDKKYAGDFDKIFQDMDATVLRIPYRSPNLNPYAESWVSIIKRECLDHFFVFGEDHFKYLISEYLKFYNTVRPHTSMGNIPLDYLPNKKQGAVKCESKLGGMVRQYYRG